jgi:hypothetical protein
MEDIAFTACKDYNELMVNQQDIVVFLAGFKQLIEVFYRFQCFHV